MILNDVRRIAHFQAAPVWSVAVHGGGIFFCRTKYEMDFKVFYGGGSSAPRKRNLRQKRNCKEAAKMACAVGKGRPAP
jgi:hypothetical protein